MQYMTYLLQTLFISFVLLGKNTTYSCKNNSLCFKLKKVSLCARYFFTVFCLKYNSPTLTLP